MAIEFTNHPIGWINEGTAPSEDLRMKGFQAGYKPPAAVFNNQWYTTDRCIGELQIKLSSTDDKKVDKVTGKSLIDENVATYVTYNTEDHSLYTPPIIATTIAGDITLHKAEKTHKLSEKLDVADFNANAVTKDSSTNMGINGELIFPHPLGGSTNYVKIDGDSGVVAHYENSDDISEEIRPDITLIQGSKTHKLSEKANVSDLPIKSLAGQTVKPTSSTTVTAAEGATIIGDLRARTFSSSGTTILNGNVASKQYSIAIGACNTASENFACAIGNSNKASGNSAIALGNKCESSGSGGSLSCGTESKAGGQAAVALGYKCQANGNASFAVGNHCTASGADAAVFGDTNIASTYAFACGRFNKALSGQFKIGECAKDNTEHTTLSTDGDAFIIGNGASNSVKSNAFRVTYAGKAYGLASYSSSGADYAEYFEWKDGNPNNEDRRGRLVTLDGEKIRFATADDDYILGVVSANPCVEGDIYSDDWQGKYLTDVFGQRLTQTVHIPARYEEQEITDPETGETTTENILIEDEHDAVQWVLNPDYDPEQEYVSREDRKEWSAIGLMGKLVVIDDGTCEVNGYCKAEVNGIATKADDGYRVMARIDDTHIRVLVR